MRTAALAVADMEQAAPCGARAEALVRKYNEALMRFLVRRSANREDAEDIAQEVYVRLARKSDLDQVRFPQAFLYRTAGNLIRDRARRDQVRERPSHILFEERLNASEVPSPERVIEGRQRLAAVLAVIDELPPKCRHVFVLHRFEGMTYSGIAAHCAISVSAVEKHMIRAIRHLDERMEDV